MISLAPFHGFLRRQPRRVAPFPNEYLSCYLRRLGEANGLPNNEFGIRVTKAAIPAREAVEALTGLPERTLVFALPELRTPDDVTTYPALRGSPAAVGASTCCPFCAGRRGLARPVQVWATHEQVLCRRHRVWTGGPVLTSSDRWPRIDISALPDVLRAHRRHQRLIPRFGREPVRHAFEDASYLVHEWDIRLPRPLPTVRARLAALEPDPGRWYRSAAICRIAEYPVVVALTTFLADDAWRSRLLLPDTTDQHAAIGYLTETVTEGVVPAGVFDSLFTRCMNQRLDARQAPAETVT